MDNLIYSTNLNGRCDKCQINLEGEGYLLFHDNGGIKSVYCPTCKDTTELTRPKKKLQLTVKKVDSLMMDIFSTLFPKWFATYYEIQSSKNMLFSTRYLKENEVQIYMESEDIEVIVKH